MSSQVKYDPKVNILSIRFSRKKSVDSRAQSNVVVDYDKDGEIVNLEIMQISLNEFAKSKIPEVLIPSVFEASNIK